jgi:hypothetical protein
MRWSQRLVAVGHTREVEMHVFEGASTLSVVWIDDDFAMSIKGDRAGNSA